LRVSFRAVKNILAIIPARFSSTRFPGKPLADLGGKTIIERVYTRVSGCKEISEILVATDDDRIRNAVEAFGGNAMMTSPNCLSGTDRCAEILEKTPGMNPDLILNVQGDEPFIQPAQLSALIVQMKASGADIGTLVQKIGDEADIHNPNVVKAVVSSTGRALYFSRSMIPFVRDAGGRSLLESVDFFRHIGLYAYLPNVLRRISALPPGKLELAENLEQLRWLEAGYSISTAITAFDSIGIDTPADLENARKLLGRFG
jgi:3-deoxy-manno-octulosonate cytidylyltransferase (CMP-KDO synthetase)